MQIRTNKTITIKKPSVGSTAVLLMCLYTLFLYLFYISEVIASVNSLVLYAFLGMSMLTLLLRWKLNVNGYWLWYLGFLFLSFCAALYAPEQQKSLSSLYDLLVVWGLTFAMAVVLTSQARMELFMRCLVLGSVVLTLYLWATGELDIDVSVGERLGTDLTGNANTFATIYMAAACSSVYFMLSQRKGIYKLFYLAAFLLQMYALSLSGGRKFFLVPLLLIYFMMLQKQDKKGRRHMIVYTVIAAVCAWLLYYSLLNVPFLYETIGNRFESLFNYSAGLSQTADASAMEREQMRQKAYELWLNAPVFGNGFNAFAQIGGWGVYSHCNYLELLCNQGIVGFAYYYGFWVYLVYRLIKKKSNHPLHRFLVGILISFLLYDYGAVSYLTPVTQFFVLLASLSLEMPIENGMLREANHGEN